MTQSPAGKFFTVCRECLKLSPLSGFAKFIYVERRRKQKRGSPRVRRCSESSPTAPASLKAAGLSRGATPRFGQTEGLTSSPALRDVAQMEASRKLCGAAHICWVEDGSAGAAVGGTAGPRSKRSARRRRLYRAVRRNRPAVAHWRTYAAACRPDDQRREMGRESTAVKLW